MFRRQTLVFVAAISVLATVFTLDLAQAEDRKKSNWGAACPAVVDATPDKPVPLTENLIFTGSGQDFKLLENSGTEIVTSPQSAIGCYVNFPLIEGSENSPRWQIGALNRDFAGFYFVNAEGVVWRLSLSGDGSYFETQPGSVYYSTGNQFRLTRGVAVPKNCKAEDYFMNSIRIGFPRNQSRVPSIGSTKNLILVVDFPDATFTGNLQQTVDNVLAPRIVTRYWEQSSNGKFSPSFEVFTKVIRLNSLESSFRPSSPGHFFVNGVQQDHRLVKEAIEIATKDHDLSDYSSINIFAPNAPSLGYYGSAFLDLQISVNGKTLLNSQLTSGGIGTISSRPASWEVFAHEYGHLLGMYDLYIPGDGNTGKSPGPFDFMGNTTGTAFTTLGYQRWVQGWLSDNDVACDLGASVNQEISLMPINSSGGRRLYVHPLSGSKVLVAEYRLEGEYESLNKNDGILVYTVDMRTGSLKGPVAIQPSEQDRPNSYSNDVERYKTAPLSNGQSVEIGDYLYYASNVTSQSATLSVIPKSLAPEFLASKKLANTPVPTPSQAPTVKKVQVKTIVCVKGKIIKKLSSEKLTCPNGFRLKN